MVAHPSRSSATGAIDNSPGGSFRHWQHTHTGRTSSANLDELILNEFLPPIFATMSARNCHVGAHVWRMIRPAFSFLRSRIKSWVLSVVHGEQDRERER
jgi:hypothetical protein